MAPDPDDRWEGLGPDGSTPLGKDEARGLRLSWVATRGDLNESEQGNILAARRKRRWRTPAWRELLDDLAARDLHRDMFGQVWSWAGTYRNSEVNIGVAPPEISVGVRDLMEDAKLWVAGDRPMPVDEAGFRFHHRLVAIHPFPNGNGRHAREMTDLLMRSLDAPRFTWGSVTLDTASKTRAEYIAALREADRGDFTRLAAFVRS